MQKKSLLNFRQFSGIFEEGEPSDEGEGGEGLKAIDIVINIFFQIYGIVVTRIGGYKDAVKDYQAIANSENEKRGELMVNTINKISDLALTKNPELKDSIGQYKKSMDFLNKAYEKILTEDKSQLFNIKKKIKDIIIDYLESLVDNVKNTKLPELEKKNESFEYFGDLILEKDLYIKERRKVIKSILPLRAKTVDLADKSIFPEIKTIAKGALKKYDAIIKTLQDDNLFDKKKRTERAEEIQNSRFSAISIENELNSSLSKIAIKYGIAKEIDDLIKKSLESLNSANTSLEKVEKKQAEESEKSKIEDSEKEEKKKEDGSKETIESYGWKSIKDGEDKKVYYKKQDWDNSKKIEDQKDKIAIGKIVKGSIDEEKKELKIYNESEKKEFKKSFSDIIDKSQADKNSKEKIEKEEKEEKKKEGYKEIKEGDKNQDSVKEIKKTLNRILPKGSSLEENGDYDKKLKESLSTAVKLMKSLGILDPSYKENTGKITVEFQKKLEEYIKKIESVRKDLKNLS
jgi:hypothetical protein